MLINLIEKTLAAFSFGQLQDFITLHKVMLKHKISMFDLEDYVKEELAVRAEKTKGTRQLREKMPECPECGSKLAIREINIPAGKRNKNGYKSESYCYAKDCTYEAYSTMTVDEQHSKYGLNTP